MRLTPKKVASWHARIERARRTIANVDREVGEHVVNVKGGDLTAVLELRASLRSARSAIGDLEVVAAAVVAREDRKGGDRR